jgi:hypothetical protein
MRNIGTNNGASSQGSRAFILDLQGRSVVDFEIQTSTISAQWVDLSTLPSGVYLLRVEGMSGSMRIVRN